MWSISRSIVWSLERALGAELSDHLGYEKGDPAGRGTGNSRNGHSGKTASTTASCRSMRELSKAWPREIRNLERQLMVWHRADETSRRLETIPGVGIITATALAASIPDPAVFQDRSPVRRLSGFGSAPELFRRQGSFRPNIEDGRSLPA